MNNVALNRIAKEGLLARKSQELIENSHVSLLADELPLSPQDWETIIKTYNQLNFEFKKTTETGEEIKNYECFRIKKSYLPEIHSPVLWKIFHSRKMLNLYNTVLPLQNPWFDRFQCHRIHPEGFHAKHCDDCTYTEYLYTMLIYPEDQYQGGEFLVYIDDKDPIVLHPKPRSIMFLKSSIHHSISEVTGGVRKSMVGFFSEGKCYPRVVKDAY